MEVAETYTGLER